MLDLRYVRENLEFVRKRLKVKGHDFDVARFEELDANRKASLTKIEAIQARLNELSRQIGEATSQGRDASGAKEEAKNISAEIDSLKQSSSEADEALWDILKRTPNIPDVSVPDGTGPEANVEVHAWGKIPVQDFKPMPHWELGEALGIFDWKRALKMTGTRFTVYRGPGAQLERALIQFMIDVQTKVNGYHEVWPPLMVNEASAFGTGNLPKFEEDLFRLRGENGHYLIPTAEVPLTNMHRDEVLDEAELPIRYAAYTPCFRAEAGSHGKDNKGMLRQHQFNKVELVVFALPELSDQAHEALTGHAEMILKELGLPFRRMLQCGTDMGFGGKKQYDLEVYLAGQEKKWWECSSCSNFGDFQARRANIKVKLKNGRKVFLHTLNGSGLATSRVLPAILENYQNADGTVTVPAALRPYMSGVDKIEKFKGYF